jgi:HTH-type transcriptional regulator/antitoxin HigA
MIIKPIRNDEDLKAVFHRLESIFQAEEHSPEADERDVLVTLVEAFENKHTGISARPTPSRPSSSAWSSKA